MDDDRAGVIAVNVLEQTLHDVDHHPELVLRQGLERRELKQVAVLDLSDALGEEPALSERVEDLPKGLVVSLSPVVVRVRDALVAVDDGVPAVAGEQADEEGLKVKADRLVECLVDDDARAAERSIG